MAKGVFLDLLGERKRGGYCAEISQVTVAAEDSQNAAKPQITSVDDGLPQEVTQPADACVGCGGAFPDEEEIYIWAGGLYHHACMPPACRRQFEKDEAMLRALGFRGDDDAQPARLSGGAV